MDGAHVIEFRHSRLQLIDADRLDNRGLLTLALLHDLPVGHLGDADRLAVDRPTRSVVMRRRCRGTFVGVSAHAETGLGILINDLAGLHAGLAEVDVDELLVLQRFFNERRHLRSGRRNRTGLQCAANVRRECFERIGHRRLQSSASLPYREILFLWSGLRKGIVAAWRRCANSAAQRDTCNPREAGIEGLPAGAGPNMGG